MLLASPKAPTLTSPDRGNEERQPVTTVRSSPRTASARRIMYSDFPNRRIYILPHVQEFFKAGLDSTWEDRLTRWTLGVRNASEEGEALPPFPTAAWTVGSQNGFEAGNELPSSPTAADVTSEGTEPALESDSLAAGVTQPEGTAPASEGDSRVRGQAEPGGAVSYVAVENTLMAEQGGVTVAGPLPAPPESAQRHPSGGEGHGGRNGPGTGERPFSSGLNTT